jgi:serine/threonine protein kinase
LQIKKHEEKINIDFFKIIDKLGNGAFGYVYLVTPKKQFSSKKPPEKLYAMKILEKEKVIKQNLARYALTERNVLSVAGNHPLIVGLDYAFQNSHRLYLIMEYCPGGDLGKQIKIKRKFTEEEARFYICEVIIAIEFLHKNKIIFRDLKPENIVLDKNGHVKLTDFGLSKENVGDLFDNKSFVGSIAYLAPEILKKQPHSKSLDWYLTGVLLYEMLVGVPPYYNNNRKILFENIQSGPLRIPHTMSLDARDLILNLLNRNPKKRMGASEADSEELKRHAFFKDINWEDVANLKLDMPKIIVNSNFKLNPDAEQTFKAGEIESE